MNLLDYFVLQHVQVSQLKARLVSQGKGHGSKEAKVELNLVPRLVKTDSGDQLPAYQVSATLTCKGSSGEDKGPRFDVRAGIVAIYQQIDGDPIDLAEFSANHASLTRQLYPLLQQELRMLLMRIGMEQVHLPFDLATRVESSEEQVVEVSGSLH